MLTKHLGVRFLYEEKSTTPTPAPTEDAGASLTADALGALPAEWVAEMHQAAMELDADVILEMLEQIREQYPSLTDTLTRLVHDYRFDTIMALTQ